MRHIHETYDDFIKHMVDGENDEWEIESIIDIGDEPPEDMNEKLVIGADFGDAKIKTGKLIYITARLVRRVGNRVDKTRVGVIETRVTRIHNNINIINR